MKHLGRLIKNHIETNKLVKKHVAEMVGISPTYLSTLFNEESMDCRLYESICHTIGLHPAAGFDEILPESKVLSDIKAETVIGPATVTLGETKALQDLIAEKERTIQILLASTGIKIGTKVEHTQQ